MEAQVSGEGSAEKMAKNTIAKVSLDEEVKTLKKHFGGIIATVKALKETVERLERKISKEENDEIKELIETQRVIEEVIVANGDAIKRIDKEIENINKEAKLTKTNLLSNDQKDTLERADGDIAEKSVLSVKRMMKRCRYFNRGYCKYKGKCKYVHPGHICKEHERNKKCENSECEGRHPKSCKWLSSRVGCIREGCDYQHAAFVNGEVNVYTNYKCVSCKDVWTDRKFVKQHMIQNHEVHFCLNCDDWVKNKQNVFEDGWTLHDADGFLRRGI